MIWRLINTLIIIIFTAKTMQARMLKLHTYTKQTPAFIVTAWCVARALLGCVTDLNHTYC
jgi:hypothetical protein